MIVVIPRVSNLRRTNLVARRGWQRLCLFPSTSSWADWGPTAASFNSGCRSPGCVQSATLWVRRRAAESLGACDLGYRSPGIPVCAKRLHYLWSRSYKKYSSLWPNDFLEGKLFNPPDRATGNWRKQARKEPTMSVSGPPPRLWRYGSWLCEGRVRKESELRWYCLLASA